MFFLKTLNIITIILNPKMKTFSMINILKRIMTHGEDFEFNLAEPHLIGLFSLVK